MVVTTVFPLFVVFAHPASCCIAFGLREQSARSLVEGLVQRYLLTQMVDMGEETCHKQVSVWPLIAVAKMFGVQAAVVDVFNRAELLGKSTAMLLASASLDDVQNLTQGSRLNMAEVLSRSDFAFPEWSSYGANASVVCQAPG